jgi:preprotein translocase subunit SecG
MLLAILLVFLILVSIALIGVVLLQRSEGGGLVSGGPSGFMTARGQGDLLTRMTWILGSIFIILSLVLTLVAGRGQEGRSVTDRFEVEAIDPVEAARRQQEEQLRQQQQQAPQPQAPAPGEAPMPTLRNPLEAPPPAAPAR